MHQWEYKLKPFEELPTDSIALLFYLNDMGKDGWELVSIGTGPTIFKRPATY